MEFPTCLPKGSSDRVFFGTGSAIVIGSAIAVFRGYRKLPSGVSSLIGLSLCLKVLKRSPKLSPANVRPSWDQAEITTRLVEAGCRFDLEQPVLTWVNGDYEVQGEVLVDRTVLVRPICQAGYNRSQIIYALLEKSGVRVSAPHGTTYGPEADRRTTDWERQPLATGRTGPFENLFGRSRIRRVGEDAPDNSELQAYYNSLVDDGGHVIIASTALAHFVDELVQYACGRSLEKIRVTSIQADDPSRLRDARAYPAFVKAMESLLVIQ